MSTIQTRYCAKSIRSTENKKVNEMNEILSKYLTPNDDITDIYPKVYCAAKATTIENNQDVKYNTITHKGRKPPLEIRLEKK